MNPFNTKLGQTIKTEAGTAVDRGFIANLSWTAVEMAAASTDGIFDGIVANTTAGGDVVATPDDAEFGAQPPCARNITVTVAASTAGDVKASAIVVAGKDLSGTALSESFTPTVNTPATLVGTKAFAVIDSVTVPEQDGETVTIDVGWGQLVALPFKLSKKRVLVTLNDGVVDTAPALTISTTVLALNTVDFNGSADGSIMDMSIIV